MTLEQEDLEQMHDVYRLVAEVEAERELECATIIQAW